MWLAVSQTSYLFFFFNDTATTEIYTLSLHDALPISRGAARRSAPGRRATAHRARRRSGERALGDGPGQEAPDWGCVRDRKSTRLNSSHANISYAVFCLKKKRTIATWWAGRLRRCSNN